MTDTLFTKIRYGDCIEMNDSLYIKEAMELLTDQAVATLAALHQDGNVDPHTKCRIGWWLEVDK